MSYAADYLNLMQRYTQGQSQRLMDVARIGGAAKMTGAQAWGQLPGQLVAIADNVGDRYMQIQRQKTLDERTAMYDRTMGTNAQANLLRATTDAAKAKTEEEAKAVDAARKFFQDYKIEIGAILKQGGEDEENFQVVRPSLEALAPTAKLAFGVPIEVPKNLTPEAKSFLMSMSQTLQKGSAEVQSWQPTVGPDGKPYRVGVTKAGGVVPGAALPQAPKAGAEPKADLHTYMVARYGQPPWTSEKMIEGRKEWEAANDQAYNVEGETVVIEKPPEGDEGNKIIPNTRITYNTGFQTAVDYLVLGPTAIPWPGRDPSPAVKEARNVVINTANAIIPDDTTKALIRADYKAMSSAEQAQVKNYLATQPFLNSLKMSVAKAEELSAKYPRFTVPKANEFKIWWDRNLSGDPNLSEMDVFIFNVSRDYAKATSGAAQSIAQMPMAAEKAAVALYNAAQNPAALKAAGKSILTDAENIRTAQLAAIAEGREGIMRLLPRGAVKAQGPVRSLFTPSTPPPANSVGPKEGDQKPIPGYPGTVQEYRNGQWVRVK